VTYHGDCSSSAAVVPPRRVDSTAGPAHLPAAHAGLRSPGKYSAHVCYSYCDFVRTLHRFRDIAVDRSEIAILGYPSCLTPPVERFPRDDHREIFSGCQWMANVPNAVEILRKITIG